MARYLLKGEGYPRGYDGSRADLRFHAENDDAALLKMCAISFATSRKEVGSLTTFESLQNYIKRILNLKNVDSDPKSFMNLALESFEELNGDGTDYYSSLRNVDTGDIVWSDGDEDDDY